MSLIRTTRLTLQAARLVWRAQAVGRGRAIPQLLAEMCTMAALPRLVEETEAHQAVVRAGYRLGRVGLLDTCLVRSLALAALLADHGQVRLHLGFEPAAEREETLRGHAWVSLAGRAIPDDSATLVAGVACAEVTRLAARR